MGGTTKCSENRADTSRVYEKNEQSRWKTIAPGGEAEKKGCREESGFAGRQGELYHGQSSREGGGPQERALERRKSGPMRDAWGKQSDRIGKAMKIP